MARKVTKFTSRKASKRAASKKSATKKVASKTAASKKAVTIDWPSQTSKAAFATALKQQPTYTALIAPEIVSIAADLGALCDKVIPLDNARRTSPGDGSKYPFDTLSLSLRKWQMQLLGFLKNGTVFERVPTMSCGTRYPSPSDSEEEPFSDSEEQPFSDSESEPPSDFEYSESEDAEGNTTTRMSYTVTRRI
jgi:hypothetical protein